MAHTRADDHTVQVTMGAAFQHASFRLTKKEPGPARLFTFAPINGASIHPAQRVVVVPDEVTPVPDEVPLPAVPLVPLVPLLPELPMVPLDPLLPLVLPAAPDEPLTPVEPLVLLEPVVPVVPLAPDEPVVPVLPDEPLPVAPDDEVSDDDDPLPPVPLAPLEPVAPVVPLAPELDDGVLDDGKVVLLELLGVPAEEPLDELSELPLPEAPLVE